MCMYYSVSIHYEICDMGMRFMNKNLYGFCFCLQRLELMVIY